MKEIHPLKLEDLTLEQKLGMTMIGGVTPKYIDYTLELIRKHALGAVWVHPTENGPQREIIKQIKEVADYPIIICCDMEGGYPGKGVGDQAALAYLNDPEETFRFARSFAAMAREDGYNTICGPVLERINGRNKLSSITRLFSTDKEVIARQAAAFIRGFHEAGILSVAKHYPSVSNGNDSHLKETVDPVTEEELLADNLYPYLKLLEQGLLDGIMTQHSRLTSIDPDQPTTLSQKVTSILRRKGFDGVYMTDDLNMMGIRAKYGTERYSRAVAGGNDLLISYDYMTPECFPKLKEDFDKGLLTLDRVNEAAARVIAMQNRTMEMPVHDHVTQEDKEIPEHVRRESLVVFKDENVPLAVDTQAHHLFIVMTEYKLDLDTAKPSGDSYDPVRLAGEIRALFPNSDVRGMQQFPGQMEIIDLLHDNLKYDDVILVGAAISGCYLGPVGFTSRAMAVFGSLAATDRIAATVFFGNPYVLETLPHQKRIIINPATRSSHFSFEVLAGQYTPQGRLPYTLKLQ